MAHDPAKLRNVVVLGHRGSGKTSLVEGLLFASGAISRMGSIVDGTTVCDFDDEERRRAMSISTSLCSLNWGAYKLNLLDTPGEPSFHGDTLSAMQAADAALMVVNGPHGVEVQTERLWARAGAGGLARAAVVSMLDRERADFASCVEALHEIDSSCIPVEIPIGSEEGFCGVVDLLSMTATTYSGGAQGASGPIPAELAAEAQAARVVLVEAVAESDDELLERYFAGEELSAEEVEQGLHAAVRTGALCPVACAAPTKGIGADRLLDLIVAAFPAPVETPVTAAVDQDGAPAEILLRADGPAAAYCFKTFADQFSGKISLLKVVGGTLSGDTQVSDSRTGAKERIGQLMQMQGKDHTNVADLGPGDIGAVAKLKDVATGDVLTAGSTDIAIAPVAYPPAVMGFAVTAKVHGEEDKVVTALRRLYEEDPSIDVHRDEQTGELIVGGLSQLHVETIVARTKRRFGVDMELHPPRVPYRETVTAEAQAEGKHRKQSGGRGQYGDCWLRIEPAEAGEGVVFVDKIVGGAIPRSFIPAVEKGVREAATSGVLAGYPVVDVRVTVFDGKYHPVDSSEMAFKIAGSLGMKAALEKAHPVLLEPIMSVSITVPEEHVGDVMGDLSSRRGHPQGMESVGHASIVRAAVPMSEMLSYAIDLRAMTGGRGDYTMEFLRYEEVPAHVAQRTVEEARTQAA